MTAPLAPDALAGLRIGVAPSEADRPAAVGGAADLVDGLTALGADRITGEAPADLLVVTLAADLSLDGAADGDLATPVTAAFGAAREGFSRLRAGGCLLFVLANASVDHAEVDPARAAIGSLTRTLALEWAPERRVNALVCGQPEDAVGAAALVAWRASRTLTGAVLDLVPASTG